MFFFQCEDVTPIVAVSGNHGTKSGPQNWERADGFFEATRRNPWRKLAWFSLANLDTGTSLTLNDHGSSAMGRCQFDWCGFRLCTHRCLEIRSFVFPHVRLRERSFEIWEMLWLASLHVYLLCSVPVLHFSTLQISVGFLYTIINRLGGPRTSERLCGRTCQKCLQPFGKECEQKQLGTSTHRPTNLTNMCYHPEFSENPSWMIKKIENLEVWVGQELTKLLFHS